MRHNYNESMLKYYKIRVNAMSKHIKKLEDKIEFLQVELEMEKQSNKHYEHK
jgi:hypothetical protein